MINKSYGILDDVYNDKQQLLMQSTCRQFDTFQHKFDENDPKLKKDLEKSTELQILNEQKKFAETSNCNGAPSTAFKSAAGLNFVFALKSKT